MMCGGRCRLRMSRGRRRGSGLSPERPTARHEAHAQGAAANTPQRQRRIRSPLAKNTPYLSLNEKLRRMLTPRLSFGR